MIVFNRNDGADIQEQLTYLNNLPQYKLFRLRAVREQMKTYDFWNEKCIIEFKKRNCNHDTFPDFILQKDKYDMNMELAKNTRYHFIIKINLQMVKYGNGILQIWLREMIYQD